MCRKLAIALILGLMFCLPGWAAKPRIEKPQTEQSEQGVWMLSPESVEEHNRISDEINQDAERKKAEQAKINAEQQAKRNEDEEEQRKVRAYQREYIDAIKQELSKPSWNVNQP